MIYQLYGGGGLGDSWASVNYVGKCHGTLSVITKDNAVKTDMLNDIISLLGVQKNVNLSQQRGDHSLTRMVWMSPYLPTVRRWKPGPFGRICYQFEGISNAHLKQPPQADFERLVSFAPGFQFVRLGKPASLIESVELMYKSDLFLGICSGFSHIAHSMGIPTFLIQYQMPIAPWHHGKKYSLCNGTNEAIHVVKSYLKI
jgi:hypothetical protein